METARVPAGRASMIGSAKNAQSRSQRATKLRSDGGYDDGYSRCACFWGRSPGWLVKRFVSHVPCKGLRVLDLGCGEGKNAYALAQAGAAVTAVDCSELAIANGRREFGDADIEWVISDGGLYLSDCQPFDVVVMYGLLHCLPSPKAISRMIASALQRTRKGGYHILATFNDGPHDLSAHPGLKPTLAPHEFYLHQEWQHSLSGEEANVTCSS
jgi:2-polyprenyl-3-methyl-5-hydroxy-6-metoxy-1,4-benzoquinol methylase